jgi:hypothetical protein
MAKKIQLPKISQSLMKALSEYVQGNECGIAFNERYIKKTVEFVQTDAMRLGTYFEYKATGALPRNGIAPEPDVVYKGTAKEKLATDFERADASALFFKALMKFWDIKVLYTNHTMETATMKGIADLIVEWNGKPVILDLKYTGMIDDKWSEFGWHKDFLSQKDNLMVQGVMYKLLAKETLGIDDIPFYFWVFDSKNPQNVRIIEEKVDESRFYQHMDAVNNAKSFIEHTAKTNGWKAKPDLLRCAKCPLKPDCKFAVDYPIIEEVYY